MNPEPPSDYPLGWNPDRLPPAGFAPPDDPDSNQLPGCEYPPEWAADDPNTMFDPGTVGTRLNPADQGGAS